jgi:hypothetical protein
VQPKAKQALHAIMNAPTRAEAEAGIEAFAAEHDATYPPHRFCPSGDSLPDCLLDFLARPAIQRSRSPQGTAVVRADRS